MRQISLIILSFFDYFHKKKIINFIKKKIDKIDTVIDVGAHHGESVKLFVKNFKTKNIFSFEPSLENFQRLSDNVRFLIKKKKINFHVYNLGLGKKEETSYLNMPLETSSSTINSINKESDYYKKKNKFLGEGNKDFFYKKEIVKIVTLDSVMKKNLLELVDLIKIDTEGFEYEVLQGSEEVLKKTRILLFEHHYDSMLLKNYTFRQVHDFLILNNFKKVFKAKMPFRKTFDYIYENTKEL